MFMKKTLASVLVAAGTFGAFALSAAYTAPSEAATSVMVQVGPPPPLRVEIVPAARHGYFWVPGYWNWRHHRHVWVAGTWVRERRGYVYRPHRWEQRDGRWFLYKGRWDRDHDGIPDSRDRHPNNPYRP